MKPSRLTALVILILGLLAAAVWWSQRSKPGFPNPEDCLEAYREACLAGDAEKYLSCLSEPLRSEQARAGAGQLGKQLRQGMAGVTGWATQSLAVEGSAARAEVEEVRRTGTRQLRFRLERSGSGWLIAGVEASPERPAAVPYGTRVGEEPPTK